jgi:DNA processing protein
VSSPQFRDVARDLLIDLCSVPRMTEAKVRNLLKAFGGPEAIFEQKGRELINIEGMTEEVAHAVSHYRRSAETEVRIRKAVELGCRVVTFLDADFPANLRSVDRAPPVLFMRGTVLEQDRLALAIIGTRRATPYGMMVAQRFARGLGEQGVTVVSGLARGIDTAAHIGAMAGGGRTIAVLGCGVDVFYPPENRKLYDQISEHGAVVSEFNLGTGPTAYNFPARNRVISGLSQGVLAVECRNSSGVLNTVRWAADQGRDVMAVPGAIVSETSLGTNQLIKDGARPVTQLEDLLEALNVAPRTKSKPEAPLSEADRMLLAHLSENPVHIDALAEQAGQPMPLLLSQLLDMEIRGIIRQLPGMMFVANLQGP